MNRPLLLTGIVVFGATYISSAIVGAESDLPSDHKFLPVPVAGPWMDVTSRDCSPATCGNEVLVKVALVADGVLQVASAVAIYASFFIPERTTKKWLLFGNGSFTVAPTVGRTSYGLGAVGTF